MDEAIFSNYFRFGYCYLLASNSHYPISAESTRLGDLSLDLPLRPKFIY